MSKTLTKVSNGREMIAGVCGGLANYFGMDMVIMRLIWALGLVVSGGTVILVYIIMALILDSETDEA